jgi:hypothetical protein
MVTGFGQRLLDTVLAPTHPKAEGRDSVPCLSTNLYLMAGPLFCWELWQPYNSSSLGNGSWVFLPKKVMGRGSAIAFSI